MAHRLGKAWPALGREAGEAQAAACPGAVICQQPALPFIAAGAKGRWRQGIYQEEANGWPSALVSGLRIRRLGRQYCNNRQIEALAWRISPKPWWRRWAAQDAASKRGYDITIDCVSISTIHSAKGLEFAHVFLLGLDGPSPAEAKDRRLAHFGGTRARESLTLSVCQSAGFA